MKGIKYIFFILLILAFGYGVIGQMVLPPDHVEETDLCEEYQGEWYRIEDDGTRSLIEMPGRYEKGTAILETTIPENLDGRISHLCFRG